MTDITRNEQETPDNGIYTQLASTEIELPNGRKVHLEVCTGSITDARTKAITRNAGWIGFEDDHLTSISNDLEGSAEQAIARESGLEPFNAAIRIAREHNGNRQTAPLLSNNDRQSLRLFGTRLGDTVVTNSGNLQQKGIQKIVHVACHNTKDHSIDAHSLQITPQAVMHAIDIGSPDIDSVAVSGEIGTGVSASGIDKGPTLVATIQGIIDYLNDPKNENTHINDIQVVLYYASADEVMSMLHAKVPGTSKRLGIKFTKRVTHQ